MKKMLLTLSLILTAAASNLFAAIKDPDPDVEAVFKNEFPGAQAVSWATQDGYQKATFILAGHRTIAFFDEKDGLAGCVRDIFYDQLPITVMKAIDKKFTGADFSEVREITNADGTSYLLIAEKDKQKYKVRISSEGSFTSVDKVKK